MVRILSFDSTEDVLAHIRREQEAADKAVQPWQAAMKPGDHFVRLIPEAEGIIAVYGEVVEPEFEPEDGPNFYNQPHMKNIRFTRCFSVMCPGGELGDTHVATMGHKLSQVQFNLAAKMGWPSDARVRQIVEMA